MDWVNLIQKINNKFKFQLFGRTINNLEAFHLNKPKYDPNFTGSMPTHAFNLFLNSCGVFLSTQQLRSIGDAFPADSTGVNYQAFIDYVRNDITTKRLATIDHAFDLLQSDDAVSIEVLLGRFRGNEHPHVRSLMQKAQKAQSDFEQAIKRRSADGVYINQLEFREYFLDVNACVPLEREEFFIDILLNGFNLLDRRVTLDRLRELEVTIFEKVRQKTYFKKDEGMKSQGTFKFFDMEDKGIVDYKRFTQTLDRLGCAFKPIQLRALFEKHCNGNEFLSYEQMCGLLFEMGSGNKPVLNPVYELAKQGNGFITTHGMTKRLH